MRKDNAMLRQHIVILDYFLEKLKGTYISSVLDTGSGKTSLSSIIRHFPKAEITAIVYPSDMRKIETIMPVMKQSQSSIRLLEIDICNEEVLGNYDLAVAHLLLGEAAKFGNHFETMLNRLLAVKCRYLILIDYLEDPSVNEPEIPIACQKHGFCVLERLCLKNDSPQVWEDFTGKHNFGYLAEYTSAPR